MNQSLLETKLVFGGFFSEKGVQGLPGLRSLLKGESSLFDREKYFQNSEMVAFSMSIPSCRPHPICLMLLPLPPLGLTSFASWRGVSMSWSLILQDSGNFLSFICPRLVFLAGFHLWVLLPVSIQLSILPFSCGTDLVFGGHIQTHTPTPQVPGDTCKVKGWWKTSTSLMHFDNNIHVPP